MFVYCKKCGLIRNDKQENTVCEACGVEMSVVPAEYLTKSGLMFASQESRNKFVEWIRQGEAYDPQSEQNRDAILRENEERRKQEISEKVDQYNQHRTRLTCPICHSERLEKISNVGKVVKVGMFGILGAGDIGKTYRCQACGYKF